MITCCCLHCSRAVRLLRVSLTGNCVRRHLIIDLFESALCSQRWFAQHLRLVDLARSCDTSNNGLSLSVRKTNTVLISAQKWKEATAVTSTLATLASEVGMSTFETRMTELRKLEKLWLAGKCATVVEEVVEDDVLSTPQQPLQHAQLGPLEQNPGTIESDNTTVQSHSTRSTSIQLKPPAQDTNFAEDTGAVNEIETVSPEVDIPAVIKCMSLITMSCLLIKVVVKK